MPVPEAACAAAFLEWAFADTPPDALIEIAYSGADGGAIRFGRLFENTPEGRDAAAAFAAETTRQEGRNVYYAPALRRSTADRSKRSRKTDVLGSWLAWADFDDPGAIEAASMLWRERGFPPHRVVVTGRKPATRAQALWRLDGALDDLDTIDAALAGVFAGLDFLGDPKVIHGDTLLRLPGTIAWPKPGKEGREPEPVTLGSIADAPEEPVSVAAFRDVFPPCDPVAARKRRPDDGGSLFDAPAAPPAATIEAPAKPGKLSAPPAPGVGAEPTHDMLGFVPINC